MLGSSDDSSAQPDVPACGYQNVHGNSAQRDINIAGRDNHITTYLTGLRRLRPRPVDPDAVIPADRFVRPPGFDIAENAFRPPAGVDAGAHVVLLVAPENHGRRSAALRLLASLHQRVRVFELLPDWDNPDVGCLPEERNAGYLLNLRGVTKPLGEGFCNELVTYAADARSAGRHLIVTASDQVWPGTHTGGLRSGVAVVRIGRPNAVEVARNILASEAGTRERSAWLDDPGNAFSKLLPDGAAPADAVRLAGVIARAKDATDADSLDEYHGWTDKIREWFGGDGDEAQVRMRAVRIAAAFLDGAAAGVVLDCADDLLRSPGIDLPPSAGGLLALPDADQRLQPAGVSYSADTGTAALEHPSQGPAMLRYLWRHRVQHVDVLTRWLQRISIGPAKAELRSLSRSLMHVAETGGIEPVFNLVEEWLGAEGKENLKLSADLLSDLAIHPTLGSRTREKMSSWAKGNTKPIRQQVIAGACSGVFGEQYPRQALTRLRYVVESAVKPEPEQAAFASVRELASNADVAPHVVAAIVDWCSATGKIGPAGRRLFLATFGYSPGGNASGQTPINAILTREGVTGQAMRSQLINGWRLVFGTDGLDEAKDALLGWRQAAEAGDLPSEPVVSTIISLSLTLGPAIKSPVKDVITAAGPLNGELIQGLLEATEQALTPRPPWRSASEAGHEHEILA